MQNTLNGLARIEKIDVGDGSTALKFITPKNNALVGLAFIASVLSAFFAFALSFNMGNPRLLSQSLIWMSLCAIVFAFSLYFLFKKRYAYVYLKYSEGFLLPGGNLPFKDCKDILNTNTGNPKAPVVVSLQTHDGQQVPLARCVDLNTAKALIDQIKGQGF